MTASESILQALARGATILTGNARAARRLHLDHARRQRALGHSAWPTPPIHDWRTWLNDMWDQYNFHHPEAPILLTPLQETELWKIAQGQDASAVVSPESLAALAQQAYSLLCDYNAHAFRRQPWTEPDAERFRQWAQAFDRICAEKNYLSASRLPEHISARLATAAHSGQLTLPAEIFLTGFDRITPAQQSLMAAMQDTGTTIQVLQSGPPRAELRALVTASEQAELDSCALWLRQQLESHPEARIAVLCPSVEQRRGAIDRTFRRILTPQIDASPDAPSTRAVYEFTLGHPIATVPIVHAAMLTLQWLAAPLAQQDLTALLLSGYLASSPEEQLACARADSALRDSITLSPLVSIERALKISRAALPQTLRQRLQATLDFAISNHFATENRLPGAWAELARIALESSGWPGFRTADSVQFQARHRWDKLLDDLALLDLTAQPIPFSQFLSRLTLHARQTLFAPESLDAPIHIMGPLESAGQEFEAVWFLNATDEQWPATGRAHPLLPLTIQRQAGMPHASPSDDWQLAHSATNRILASAAQVTFSRARQNKDGELRPSPITTTLTQEQSAPETVTNPPNPESFTESWQESAPIPFPGGVAPGGASLLRDQAACPFRAFATRRLRAGEISEPESGLTPIQRGNILHSVLYRFWSAPEPRPIATRNDLLDSIRDGSLPSILRHHIDASFAEEFPGDLTEPWLLAYIESDKRRLTTLLTNWLTHESTREFFAVAACEKSLHDVTIGPLQLHLKADRIDRLQDGTHLLIDYKTGQVSTAAWQGDRPDEPQLPLYAVYGNVENVSGLLFAQIRTQDAKFIGRIQDARTQLFADIKDSSPLVKYPYEDSMHDQWQSALAALAEEFAQGQARITPKHGEQTCQYCPLPSLCRIHEINDTAETSPWDVPESDEEQENEDA
ncbi:MAG: PD-(D/E)XK nuclease family protein [Acidobacteriaceae bacterium]